MESVKDADGGGFNAQPVKPGIVVVTYNSYDHKANMKRLTRAQKVLKDYDTKIVYAYPDRESDEALLIAPKGAFENPVLKKSDTILTIIPSIV